MNVPRILQFLDFTRFPSAASRRSMIRPFDVLVAGGLGLAVVAAPLPFGSVTAEARLALQVFAFVMLATVLAVRGGKDSVRHSRVPLRLMMPTRALLALAALGVLQIVGLPAWLGWISPGHFAGRDGWSPLTLSLADSQVELLGLLAGTATLVLAAIVGAQRRLRRFLGAGILVSALLQLALGFPAWIERRETIWNRIVPNATDRLRGTFINPNHLALFLEMALAVTFAWGWWSIRRARSEYSADRKVMWAAPPIVVGLFLATGLIFTGSRAGLLALIATLLTQALVLGLMERRWKLGARAVLPVALIMIVLAFGVGGQSFARLTSTTAYDIQGTPRSIAYAATFELWKRFPVFGSGLGSFQEAFPLVQTADIFGTWRHAHSMPLEILATVGIVGAILLTIALLLIARLLVQGIRNGARSEDRAAALAALGALTAVLVHDSLDFGITMPANAFTLAVILGAGLAVRWKPDSGSDPGQGNAPI